MLKNTLGTGGALENAKKFIVNNTLVCNGDTYFDYRFEDLKKLKTKSNCAFLILVKNKTINLIISFLAWK